MLPLLSSSGTGGEPKIEIEAKCMPTKLTRDDERVLEHGPVSREQFIAAREAEKRDAARLAAQAALDSEGLSAADRELLARTPSIDRKAFVRARADERWQAAQRKT
jgi:hypothetical protein